jgi:replicative DNA helicase
MEELNKEELLDTVGGSQLTATLLSTLIRGANTSYEVGRALGSSLKRMLFKCK